MLLNIQVFVDVTLCRWVSSYWRLERSWCQGSNKPRGLLDPVTTLSDTRLISSDFNVTDLGIEQLVNLLQLGFRH